MKNMQGDFQGNSHDIIINVIRTIIPSSQIDKGKVSLQAVNSSKSSKQCKTKPGLIDLLY